MKAEEGKTEYVQAVFLFHGEIPLPKETDTPALRVRGVDFDASKGLFSTKPEQETFEMPYFLKGKPAEALTGAKLLIPTGAPGERVIVSLDKASHDGAAGQTLGAE